MCMRKLLLDKTFPQVNAAINEVVDGNPNTTVTLWEDLLAPIIGKKLYSGQGKADYDWTEGSIIFQPNGNITKDNDVVLARFQKRHSIKMDTNARLHIHWKQVDGEVLNPTFTVRYRVEANGGDCSNEIWKEVSVTSSASNEVFPRPTSGGSRRQTTKIENIDWGGSLVSTELLVRLTRSDNQSGNVIVTNIICHVPVDQRGSKLEFDKSE